MTTGLNQYNATGAVASPTAFPAVKVLADHSAVFAIRGEAIDVDLEISYDDGATWVKGTQDAAGTVANYTLAGSTESLSIRINDHPLDFLVRPYVNSATLGAQYAFFTKDPAD